mmetsp:Transcript_10645/g.10748  ORF Transcript_10645/g.10748 Transcript_10645/m.10748 type:complete len:90 (+) Transcript_10645:606-875(+)
MCSDPFLIKPILFMAVLCLFLFLELRRLEASLFLYLLFHLFRELLRAAILELHVVILGLRVLARILTLRVELQDLEEEPKVLLAYALLH